MPGRLPTRLFSRGDYVAGRLLYRNRGCVFRPDVGIYEGGGPPLGERSMEYAIAGVVAAALFVYLMYALLRPEKF